MSPHLHLLSPRVPLTPLAGFGLCSLLLAVIGLGGCADESDHEKFKKVTTVESLVIQPGLLLDTVEFGGQLISEKSVVLKSEVDGILESVEFEEGQYVHKGDVLFKLRSGEQVALLQAAEANLALAISDARRAEALLSLDAAAQSRKEKAAAEREVARSRVQLAKIALSQTKIRAPFDGMVGIRLVSPGEFLTEQVSLVQIDSVDRLQVIFAMSEVALPLARVGIPVHVLVAPYPGERFPGEVFFISPTLDTKSRRLLVKARVPNEDRRLAAGLYANIEVQIRRQEGALLVPESAVVSDQLGTFVWRIDDGDVATRVPIGVGLRKGGRVEITSGLVGGDRIVTAGTHKVSDGEKVAHVSLPVDGQASLPTEMPHGEGT